MNEGEQHSEGIQQAEIDKLFSQLTAAEVDEFYQAYQLWCQRQRAVQIQQELQALREKQAQNTARMQSIEPSAIVLSAIAQLRVHGVDDVDLLDRMLDRGEEWLDNTMQLLARCEALNVIQGNYAQWCEHALEGAYEWMWSMDDANLSSYFDVEQPATTQPQEETTQTATEDVEVTEAQLLQKLMSEEGEEKAAAQPQAKITRPLPVISPDEVLAQSEAFMPLSFENISEEDQPDTASDIVNLQYDEEAQDTPAAAPGESAESETVHDQATQIVAEPASTEQVIEPAESEETRTAPNPSELADENSSGSDMITAEHSEKDTNALTDTPSQEQLSDTPPQELLLRDEPQEQGEAEETSLSGKEPQGQVETIEEKEPAPEGQWPYVYQQVPDNQPATTPEAPPKQPAEQKQPDAATPDNSTKPHAAGGKSQGLLKRSLNRFLRR